MPSPPSDDRSRLPLPNSAGAASATVDPALAETRPHADRAAPPDRSGDPLIGQCVRAYRIERELGRGGMGVVYEAKHIEIGQRAAVKTLNLQRLGGSASDPAIAQRFLTEAKALAIARHPGLVQLFDYGQLPDGTLFLLMEYLEGQSLADRRESRPAQDPAAPGGTAMTPVDALRIGRQIADALVVAHEKGIFHRDLKPSNVYLVADSEAPAGERVKILDFGLARIAVSRADDAGSAASSARTSTSVVMGTPIYMAPEQCRGLSLADGQADVYSLGVLLYELLAGTPPFTGTTSGDLIAMHIYRQPQPLSRRARGVPRPLADLVMQMLRKEPDQRPTMAQVSRTLRQLESAGPPKEQDSLGRRMLPWVLGLGLAGAGLLWRQRVLETPLPDRGPQPTIPDASVVNPQPPVLQPPVTAPTYLPTDAGLGHGDAAHGIDPGGDPASGASIPPSRPAPDPLLPVPTASAPPPARAASSKERTIKRSAPAGHSAAAGTPPAVPSPVPAVLGPSTQPAGAGVPAPEKAPAPTKPDEEVNVPALR